MSPRTPTTTQTSWVRVARQAQRLTQAELAELTGLSRIAIIHIESGTRQPRVVSQRALANALGYTTLELFPRDGRSPSSELRSWATTLNRKAAS